MLHTHIYLVAHTYILPGKYIEVYNMYIYDISGSIMLMRVLAGVCDRSICTASPRFDFRASF